MTRLGTEASGKKRARVRVHESEYGRELIVDETFASLYRPGRAATGSVWDAIAAPLVLRAQVKRARLLLLGLGGGSVARLARTLAPTAEIVGVELDPEVVAVARESFALDALDLEIHIEDARDRLAHERRRFDVIFEDVFVGRGDDVHKPDWIPNPGLAQARSCLREGGVLVTNTLDEAPRVASFLRARFASVVQIEIDGFDNRVFAATDAALDARTLRTAVAAEQHLADALPALSFRTV